MFVIQFSFQYFLQYFRYVCGVSVYCVLYIFFPQQHLQFQVLMMYLLQLKAILIEICSNFIISYSLLYGLWHLFQLYISLSQLLQLFYGIIITELMKSQIHQFGEALRWHLDITLEVQLLELLFLQLYNLFNLFLKFLKNKLNLLLEVI